MSAHGFTPPRSEPTTASEGATSSSHQPPLKTLRALEAADEVGSSPRVLNSSTDGEDTKGREEDALPVPTCPVLSPRTSSPESSALPVPHAPLQGEEEPQGEEHHDADNFVPEADRTKTLEQNTTERFKTKSEARAELFEIGSEKGEEEVKEDEGSKVPSSTVPSEMEGPQPSTPSNPKACVLSVNSSARSSSLPPPSKSSRSVEFVSNSLQRKP